MKGGDWPSMLVGPRIDGYLDWPVPDVLDEQIAAVLSAAIDGPEGGAALEQLRSGVDSEEAGEALGCFAQRAAVIAVRRGDRAWLDLAVVGLGLANGQIDYRNAIVVITLMSDAARRLGIDIMAVLADQRSMLDADSAQRFATYLDRDPPATPGADGVAGRRARRGV